MSQHRSDPWFWPAPTAAAHGAEVHCRPGEAGQLQYAGLEVYRLEPGAELQLDADGLERLVVPLAGTCTAVMGAESFDLGRAGSVFDAAPDVLYLPTGQAARLTAAAGAQLAIATAPATRAYPVQFRGAQDVQTEQRGAVPALRSVRDIGGEHVVQAQRLLVCEVLTPPGGWSSYPPHKHDVTRTDDGVRESDLEEIYYFRIEGEGAPSSSDHAVGYHRTFASDDRPIDTLAEVRSGDVALVPYGWHGPCMAPPGYRMYYLNVMAGPQERTWQVCYHPDLEWTRQ